MKHDPAILVLGAGKSSSCLIQYLQQQAVIFSWNIIIADISIELAIQKVAKHTKTQAISFDIHDETEREEAIQKADIVISLMPPSFHYIVAQTCIKYSKHLLTASYLSPEIKKMYQSAIDCDILILMEMGLDPGIDHMSAMREIESIHHDGGKLYSFKSYTGGLIAPESDDNPWHYKITWNPRNVVLAGQGISKYLEEGTYKEVSYKELFRHIDKIIVEDYGFFEGYANRDSLSYMETYGLDTVTTFMRGTLRREGFCSAWNVLVQIGLTDDTYKVNNSEIMTYRQLLEWLMQDDRNISLQDKLRRIGTEEDIQKLEWLGLFTDQVIGLKNVSPAMILQNILEEKLKLGPGDKDMIVMQHQFGYELHGKKKNRISSLVVKGEDEKYTAMAKTVGLPLGIAAKLLLQGRIAVRGVQIPVLKEIYEPVLSELEQMNISFFNKERDVL